MDAGEHHSLCQSHYHSDATVSLPLAEPDEERRQGAADAGAKDSPEHDALYSVSLAEIAAQELGEDVAPEEAGQDVRLLRLRPVVFLRGFNRLPNDFFPQNLISYGKIRVSALSVGQGHHRHAHIQAADEHDRYVEEDQEGLDMAHAHSGS